MSAPPRAPAAASRIALTFIIRLSTENAETGEAPVLRLPIEWIGVDTLFVPGEQLERACLAVEADAGLDEAADLGSAVADRTVDREQLTGPVRKDAHSVGNRTPDQQIQLADPGVINVGVLRRVTEIERAIDGGAGDRQ